jgi:hypothetical protein
MEREPRLNRANGFFTVFFGFLFLIALVFSFIGKLDLNYISPDLILRVWLGFATIILLGWGLIRICTWDQSPRWRISQPTISFVLTIIGTTIALFALVVKHP